MSVKLSKKIIVSSILLTSSVVPTYVSAAPMKQDVKYDSINIQLTSTDYSKFTADESYLYPEGMDKALEETGSNALQVDLYALTVLKQPLANFDGISIVDKETSTRIVDVQTKAKENASYWLNVLKGQLIDVTEGIIDYNTIFEAYYDDLKEAIESQDKEGIKKLITELLESVSEKAAETKDLLMKLKKFRNDLIADVRNFKDSHNSLTAILTSENKGIGHIKSQIEMNKKLMQDAYRNQLITDTVGTTLSSMIGTLGVMITFTGIGAKVGVTLIAVSAGGSVATGVLSNSFKNEAKNATDELNRLYKQLSKVEKEILSVENIKDNNEKIKDTIDRATVALQNLSNQWGQMDSKYRNLIKNIDKMSKSEIKSLRPKLNSAKISWVKLEELAEEIHKKEIQYIKINN